MKCPHCHAENPDGTRFCSSCAAPLNLGGSEGVSLTKTLATPLSVISKDALIAGKYKIVEEIGRGGMGVVYKAEDIKLKRPVALKFLPPELTHIPEVKDRFMREAQAAAALDHPNICTVYEFDQAEGKAFISMAYIEGQSLKKKIDSGPLELEEALKIATQVAEGLQEAHRKGIVHRDIKSANIMVTAKGLAKVMDFGLARVSGSTLVTREGTTMGTVTYMSPEQARGETVDHRTDIWSFGVVLYELLTGELPFRGENEQGIVYSILKEKPKPITDIKAGLPVSIEQVVSKALEKDPGKRYQQVDELLDDLKSISAGIVPEEIKARLRKAKLQKRKRAILYAGAAGLTIIMAVLSLSLFTGRAEAIDSIAVLPLKNQTGDTEQDYFVDGATDELIGQLSKIGALQVKSRTTVMQFKGVDKSIPEIARELNVDAVVEGTVYQIGEKIRITVRLYDALPEERRLWAETYDRDMAEVVVMYSEMARSIAEKSRVTLTAEETTRLSNARQVNPEAYEACLRGSYHWTKATPVDLDIAEKYFDSALEKDPGYAPAYVGHAFIWLIRNQLGFLPPEEAGPKAKAAALRAIELDENSAGAHEALASVRYLIDWDWDGAWESWRRTLELNPNGANAQALYAHFLMIMGHGEEALIHSERAVVLDPFNPLLHGFRTGVLVSQRRYDEALATAREAQRLQPGHYVASFALWIAYEFKGMKKEALEAAKLCARAAYGDARIEAALDEGFAQGGYAEAMKRAAEFLVARLPETYCLPGDIAVYYAYAGEKDKAFEWFERGLEVHDPGLPYLGASYYESLRPDPRYQDLLRRMGLPTDEKK